MDRREFLNLIGAGAIAPSLLANLSPEPEISDWDSDMQWMEFPAPIDAMTKWHDVFFIASRNRVYWTDRLPMDIQDYEAFEFIDLPSDDSCSALCVDADLLWWYGQNEVWRVLDTERKYCRFVFEKTPFHVVRGYNMSVHSPPDNWGTDTHFRADNEYGMIFLNRSEIA